MSVQTSVGSERNLLDETPEHARQLVIDNPILLDSELEQLRQVARTIFKSHTIDITWPVAEGAAGMERALERVCDEADEALADGANILILSDRAVGAERVADPAAARGLGRAPPPRARGHPPAGRARRSSRASRASVHSVAADRLRRRGGQPVPDARDPRRARREGRLPEAMTAEEAQRARSRASPRAC